MKIINVPEYEGKTLISAQVINYGDRPTTITNLGFMHFTGRWNLIRQRSATNIIVAIPSLYQQIPFELKPGTSWTGFAEQTSDLERMARQEYLICHIYHTHSRRPLKQRVTLPLREPNPTAGAEGLECES